MAGLTQLTLMNGATRVVRGDVATNGNVVAAAKAQGGGFLRFDDLDGDPFGVEAGAVMMVDAVRVKAENKRKVGFA